MNGPAVLKQVFAQRNFARYVAGNSISLIGNWIQRTTIAWLVWDLTGSATWLGIIAFADLFPAILVGPYGGVLADRVSRRTIIMIAQAIMMGLSFGLALLAWSDSVDRWILLSMVLIHGTMVGINQPARLAFVSALIEPPLLPTAVAINSIIFNTARFIGPAIAGILLTTIGTGWTFFVNSLTYLPFLIALYTLDLPAKIKPTAPKTSLANSIGEGVRHLWNDRLLKPLLGAFLACSILVRPITELLPAVADGRFAQGAIGLAWMSGALGVGAMIGGYTLAIHPAWVAIERYRYWLLGCGLATLSVVLAPSFPLAVLAIASCGFCFVFAGVGANTLVQTRAPDELRGRVLSLYGIIVRATPAIGALVLGLVADRLGLTLALGSSVLIFAMIFLVIAWRTQVRH